MLERLKGARPDQTEAEDRKRDEAKAGMPRFEPQPGGFGRRATPIATNPAANSAANSDSPPAIGARPAARPPQVEIEVGVSPQFRKPEPPRPAQNPAARPTARPAARLPAPPISRAAAGAPRTCRARLGKVWATPRPASPTG